jgi:cyclohexyl-isocyanide hydratase
MLPVSSDRGLGILPTCTFESCPPLDLICLPGGGGVVEALADVETVDFIRRQGGHAEYVTSVCMGAFLVGAAGLLKGRRAATHWAYVDLLPLVGAIHEKGRVVRDGNVFTSGGVTSGIDFAFRIVAELAGPEVAQAIQLGIEYDPSPPFDAGHPDKASEAATALMVHRNEKAHTGIQQALKTMALAGKV